MRCPFGARLPTGSHDPVCSVSVIALLGSGYWDRYTSAGRAWVTSDNCSSRSQHVFRSHSVDAPQVSGRFAEDESLDAEGQSVLLARIPRSHRLTGGQNNIFANGKPDFSRGKNVSIPLAVPHFSYARSPR